MLSRHERRDENNTLRSLKRIIAAKSSATSKLALASLDTDRTVTGCFSLHRSRVLAYSSAMVVNGS